jgi:hypothetical protein
VIDYKITIPGKLQRPELDILRVYNGHFVTEGLESGRNCLSTTTGRTDRMNNTDAHQLKIPYSQQKK